jgi:hypothetical protein
MKNLRYFLLMLFVLAPGLVLAQTTSDSVQVTIGTFDEIARGAAFGTAFEEDVVIGPLPLITAEPLEACDPITNAGDMAGNVALISRGSCAFVTKVENASNAGAAAIIIFNNDAENPDQYVLMGGDCDPSVCSSPAGSVTFNMGQTLLLEAELGGEATLNPVAIMPRPDEVVVENDVVATSLFEAGFFGGDPSFGFGEGFTFEGADGLFVGTVLVGVDNDVTTNPYDGASEFEPISGPNELASVPAPFDTGAEAVFSSPLGFTVTLTAYADADAPNQDFVVLDVEVENTSGSAISGAYVGLFADFDAGSTTSEDDAAGVDTDLSLVYVFDPAEETKYWGVTAIGESLSGYSTTAQGPEGEATDADLWTALTSANEPGADPAERATVIGVGPFDIDADAIVTARFALVAGSDLNDLLANAALAQGSGNPAVEASTPEGTYLLGSAYPNPVSSSAKIDFDLPTAQDVTLKVYDVLGREVATLAEGVLQSGEHTVEFDAAALPSGVYVYRLEAGSVQLTERMTIVR